MKAGTISVGKSRLEIEFAGKTGVQVFDEANGWKVRPFLNRNEVEPFTPDELKAEQGKPKLDGPLVDYAVKGTKVQLEGVEAMNGHNAYKLKLTTRTGATQHIWIDAQSFFDLKVERQPRRTDGKGRTVWIYRELPTRVRNQNSCQLTRDYTGAALLGIEVGNQPLPPGFSLNVCGQSTSIHHEPVELDEKEQPGQQLPPREFRMVRCPMVG